jgi:septal ring factor EnvC (AmiA/AmiB activator)
LIPQALQLIKDKPLRNFRIEVASDSLVQLDENQMKQDRLEFLNTYSNFLTQALPVGERSPEMIPMMMELLKYGVGAFKQARGIEGALDQAMDQLKKSAGQPKPDPAAQQAQADAQMEQQKAQMQAQLEQAKMQSTMQIEQMKLQAESQIEAQRQQMEAQRQQQEAQFKVQELAQKEQYERWKTELEAATRIMVDLGGNVNMALGHMANLHDRMANMHGEAMGRMGEVMASLKSPKRIVRGPDGRAVGVEPVEPVQQQIPGLEQPTLQ